MTTPDIGSKLLARARRGDPDALGELLGRHRGYLRVIAERIIGRRLGNRLDVSDIVQQTCLSAFGKIEDFPGVDAEEFLAWLRTIHERNVKNALRDHVGAQKTQRQSRNAAGRRISARRGTRQRRKLAEPAHDAGRAGRAFGSGLAAPAGRPARGRAPTISGRLVAGAGIAEYTGRTKFSVAGLIKRGLIGLRKHLRKDHA